MLISLLRDKGKVVGNILKEGVALIWSVHRAFICRKIFSIR